MGYKGEIRATGDVLRDQWLFMSRCGIDAFEVRPGTRIEDFRAALGEQTVFYQPAADRVRNVLELRHNTLSRRSRSPAPRRSERAAGKFSDTLVPCPSSLSSSSDAAVQRHQRVDDRQTQAPSPSCLRTSALVDLRHSRPAPSECLLLAMPIPLSRTRIEMPPSRAQCRGHRDRPRRRREFHRVRQEIEHHLRGRAPVGVERRQVVLDKHRQPLMPRRARQLARLFDDVRRR